eukprot:TRINITY_DN7900_c0_g1_i3.p1 TRINITY_DN7900_c0_g1~~TRINITY_DN7900_c0_g1_i3.p1  ORF type:complete len:253 (-),score=64.10 TRINITY_DN7900_c0_g1_i3:60-818(-)
MFRRFTNDRLKEVALHPGRQQPQIEGMKQLECNWNGMGLGMRQSRRVSPLLQTLFGGPTPNTTTRGVLTSRKVLKPKVGKDGQIRYDRTDTAKETAFAKQERREAETPLGDEITLEPVSKSRNHREGPEIVEVKQRTGSNRKLVGTRMPVGSSLPHVLILHCGGTFGMGVDNVEKDISPIDLNMEDYEIDASEYKPLQAGGMLSDILEEIPELSSVANVDVTVVFNKDSSEVQPNDWGDIARIIHEHRNLYE